MQDLINQKFHKLKVLEFSHKIKYKKFFKCLCDCGNYTTISIESLKRKKNPTKSCGCLKKFQDLRNRKFGMLKVIKQTKISENNKTKYLWECVCKCKNKVFAYSGNLRKGKTKSCQACRYEYDHSFKGSANRQHVLKSYKKNAKQAKREWSLTDEEAFMFFKQNCYYCGREPFAGRHSNPTDLVYVYNGLDRKNNSIGYTKENVVACCKTCNFSKRTSTYEEFISWGKILGKNLEKENR